MILTLTLTLINLILGFAFSFDRRGPRDCTGNFRFYLCSDTVSAPFITDLSVHEAKEQHRTLVATVISSDRVRLQHDEFVEDIICRGYAYNRANEPKTINFSFFEVIC